MSPTSGHVTAFAAEVPHPESIPSWWGQINLVKLPSVVSSNPWKTHASLTYQGSASRRSIAIPTLDPPSCCRSYFPPQTDRETKEQVVIMRNKSNPASFLLENTNSLCRWSLSAPLCLGEERENSPKFQRTVMTPFLSPGFFHRPGRQGD